MRVRLRVKKVLALNNVHPKTYRLTLCYPFETLIIMTFISKLEKFSIFEEEFCIEKYREILKYF